jgi:hypothetical protein
VVEADLPFQRRRAEITGGEGTGAFVFGAMGLAAVWELFRLR